MSSKLHPDLGIEKIKKGLAFILSIANETNKLIINITDFMMVLE